MSTYKMKFAVTLTLRVGQNRPIIQFKRINLLEWCVVVLTFKFFSNLAATEQLIVRCYLKLR